MLARIGAGHQPQRPATIASADGRHWTRLGGATGGLSVIGKRRLLDERQEITGYHRKSLLRLLNRPEPAAVAEPDGSLLQPDKPHHRRRYGPEVVEALVPLWEASDRLCGKRLQALLPLLEESLERHGHLSLEPAVRESLLAMSSATIDRLLAPIRKQSGGNGWRRPPWAYSAVRRRVRFAHSRAGTTTAIPAGWRSTWWPTAAAGWRGASCGP